MKIGILSDTHDHVPQIVAAAAKLRAAGVAQVFHAGDFIAPFALKPLAAIGAPVTAVFGNNDGERLGLKAVGETVGVTIEAKFAFREFDGLRIAMHHEPEPVEALAASGLYDLVIYGHTHQLEVRQVGGGAWIVNPGEVGGWVTGRQTIVVVDTAGGEPQVIEW